jgi:hypothetical protein
MSVTGINDYQLEFYEYIRWNGQLVYMNVNEQYWDANAAEDYDRFKCYTHIHFLLYANIEIGLFVIEEVDIYAKGQWGPLVDAPVYPQGTWRKRRTYVWWQGVEYTLFVVNMPFDQHSGFPNFPWSNERYPTVWNQFPFIIDTGMPQPEDYEDPFDVSGTWTEWSWMFPFLEFYEEPVEWFRYSTATYPTFLDDIHSQLFPGSRNPNNCAEKTGFLQVFVDPGTESWVVRCKNVIPLGNHTYTTSEWPERAINTFSINFTIDFPDGGGDLINYVHGKNTLYKIGSNAPSFSGPGAITETHII